MYASLQMSVFNKFHFSYNCPKKQPIAIPSIDMMSISFFSFHTKNVRFSLVIYRRSIVDLLLSDVIFYYSQDCAAHIMLY